MAEGKGAMGTNPKMLPQQHNGSGSSWRYRCKGSVAGACKRWWGDPGYRVPMCRRHGNKEEQLMFTGEYNNQPCISQNTSIRPRAVVLDGYTFKACVLGAVRVKRCSRSRSSWEVVVLGDGRGSSCSRFVVGSSRSRGDGSRSRS